MRRDSDKLFVSFCWAVLAVVMLFYTCYWITAGSVLVTCVAMFTFSVDGYNAYRWFKMWYNSKRGW